MVEIERVQTGLRMERRILKVLKGLAEFHDITLGDLLEGIVLHAFDGKVPFGPQSRQVTTRLRKVYALDLTAADSHKLVERKKAEDKKEKGTAKS
jgi:hypothetical protein